MLTFQQLENGDAFTGVDRDIGPNVTAIKVSTDEAFILSGDFALSLETVWSAKTVVKVGRVASSAKGAVRTF